MRARKVAPDPELTAYYANRDYVRWPTPQEGVATDAGAYWPDSVEELVEWVGQPSWGDESTHRRKREGSPGDTGWDGRFDSCTECPHQLCGVMDYTTCKYRR